MKLRSGAIFIGLTVIFAILWLMWPAPINPVYWDEPEAPAMTGTLTPNTALRDARLIPSGLVGAARCVVLAEDGTIYYGNASGAVLRHNPDGDGEPDQLLADFGDLPVIGLEWINPTKLGVATPDGLFAVNLTDKSSYRISAGVPGYPFGHANDLAVTTDGEIYFTDSSILLGRRGNHRTDTLDMLENRPYGALYVWDPRTHQTRLAADRLYFPNGIAISSDEQSVFISESFRYRILRHWVTGPRAGETEVFADNLPGLPDGLTTDGTGHLFVAIPAQRTATLRTIRRHPWLAQIISRLPAWLQPTGGTGRPLVAVLDESNGAIVSSLHDPDGGLCRLSDITLSSEHDLWFGSSDCGYIAHLPQATVYAGLDRPGSESVGEGR